MSHSAAATHSSGCSHRALPTSAVADDAVLGCSHRTLSTSAATLSSTSTAASTDPLLQPFQLKHLSLRNRIFSTSHAPNYVEDKLPQRRYRLYHMEKAKGGLGTQPTFQLRAVPAELWRC
jgi:hypothetical protein